MAAIWQASYPLPADTGLTSSEQAVAKAQVKLASEDGSYLAGCIARASTAEPLHQLGNGLKSMAD